MTDELLAYGLQKMKEMGIVDGGDAAKLGIGIITEARMKQTWDMMVANKLIDTTKSESSTTRGPTNSSQGREGDALMVPSPPRGRGMKASGWLALLPMVVMPPSPSPLPGGRGAAAIEIRAAEKTYASGVRALLPVDLDGRGGRIRDPARPVRLRQEHAAQHGGGAAGAVRRAGAGRHRRARVIRVSRKRR